MNNVKITDMKMCRPGAGPVATFSAVVNGVALTGCLVFRQPDGHMTVVPPKAISGDSEKKAVWFHEKDLRDLFRARALAVYGALVGYEDPLAPGALRLLPVEPADEPEDEPLEAGMLRFLSEGERESLA